MKKFRFMEDEYGSLEEIFKEPPNEFRMMPFWFWNHEIIEKEVERQILDHAEHGLGGEFIHPRHGRLTPYMGKRWLENIEHAADIGKRLGMPIFLYDEDNWPSGPVGGKITGPYRPENRAKFITIFDELDVEPGEPLKMKLEIERFSEEARFLAAIAVPEPAQYPFFEDVVDEQIDITEHVKDNYIEWSAPDDRSWIVIIFISGYTSYYANLNGYIDTLRKETVKEFIKETHEKYVKWFIDRGKGDYLGTVVPGIFTDEPTMASIHIEGGAFSEIMPYTTELPELFEKTYGYSFNSILLSLFYDTGKISAKHRCEFWELKTKMYVEAFYKQIYEFCDKYNWRFTGHILEEGIFPAHIFHHGDFFEVFKYMHYGGCDQLTEQFRPDGLEDFWNIHKNPYTGMARDMVLTTKLASSAAHLLGKPRVLVEAFGTSSWDITLASAKRINDYLIATGCDLFVPHDFAYSEDGYRKMDHPASFNYQPYYKHWKLLTDHNARLSAVLNAHTGILQPEALLYYGKYSFYSEMKTRTSELAELLGITFTHTADCLFRQQVDFEIANDSLILGGEIIKGDKDNPYTRIKIRDEEFRVFILGAQTCISEKFAQFLYDFYKKGGIIIAMQILPFKEPHEGVSEKIINQVKEIFGLDPYKYFNDLKTSKIDGFSVQENNDSSGGRAIFVKGPISTPYYSDFYPIFSKAVDLAIPKEERDIWLEKTENGDSDNIHPAYILGKHKKNGQRDFYFLTNTSADIEYYNVKVILNKRAEAAYLWNTYDGNFYRLNNKANTGDKFIITLDFPRYTSYLIVLDSREKQDGNTSPETNPADADNILDLIKLGRPGDAKHRIRIEDPWKVTLYDVNIAMLYKNWYSELSIEARHSGNYQSVRTFMHDFYIKDKENIGEVQLVIDGLVGDYAWGWSTSDELKGGDRATFKLQDTVVVYINDKKVHLQFDYEPKFIDPMWIAVNITPYLKEGKNTIKFQSRSRNHNPYHVITDPWRLIGKFSVDEETYSGIPLIYPLKSEILLGDLREQGFGRYWGGFGYVKKITIPESIKEKDIGKIILRIENTADCVEVKINGELHEVLWHRWYTDITDKVEPGKEFTLELVYYGIAQNMMQTNTFPQGLEGPITLEFY